MLVTFKAENDLRFRLQLALLTAGAVVTFGAFIVDRNYLALIVSLPLLLATAVCGMQLCGTVYTLGTDLLTARSGLSRVEVAYTDITVITDSKDTPVYGYVPLATSANKLYVVYMQDDRAYRLELSPQDRAGFVEALGRRLAH